MSLVLIDSDTVSSPTGTVDLTGIDSTYNVYKIVANNVKVSADDALSIRVEKSGSAQTDSEYDDAKNYVKADAAFAASASGTGRDQIDFTATIDSGDADANGNGVAHLFCFSNASEYSFLTVESVHFQYNVDAARGFTGGFVHTVASASDGVLFKTNGGNNITAGTFKLYGIKK